MDIELIVIGMAWVVIALMLAWGTIVALYRLLADQAAPLPFFAMIERQGVNALQLEAAVGAGGMARALRRCALCAGRRDCARGRRVDCPNEALIKHVARLA